MSHPSPQRFSHEQRSAADPAADAYQPAEWRGTLPPEADGSVRFSLNLPRGQVLRVWLGAACARSLRETLDPRYWKADDTTVRVQRLAAQHEPPYWPFAPRTAEQERIEHPHAEHTPDAPHRERRAA